MAFLSSLRNRKPVRYYFLCVFFCFLLCESVYGSESYFINDSPVLLYKIINWWYDSVPEDDANYCGSRITCRNTGDLAVVYHDKEKKLVLQCQQGIASLLSVTKPCGQCFGPSYLKCVYLNENLLGKGKAEVVVSGTEGIGAIAFHEIDPKYGLMMQRRATALIIEVHGTVCGLLDGKISLHASGGLIKHCPGKPMPSNDTCPITLKIVDADSNDLIATYSAVWDES